MVGAADIPFSKRLYMLCYMWITVGASGLFLTIIFYVVGVKHFRKPVVLLQWTKMNALIIFSPAACNIFLSAVQGFYWRSPEVNLVSICLLFRVPRFIILAFIAIIYLRVSGNLQAK